MVCCVVGAMTRLPSPHRCCVLPVIASTAMGPAAASPTAPSTAEPAISDRPLAGDHGLWIRHSQGASRPQLKLLGTVLFAITNVMLSISGVLYVRLEAPSPAGSIS